MNEDPRIRAAFRKMTEAYIELSYALEHPDSNYTPRPLSEDPNPPTLVAPQRVKSIWPTSLLMRMPAEHAIDYLHRNGYLNTRIAFLMKRILGTDHMDYYRGRWNQNKGQHEIIHKLPDEICRWSDKPFEIFYRWMISETAAYDPNMRMWGPKSAYDLREGVDRYFIDHPEEIQDEEVS